MPTIFKAVDYKISGIKCDHCNYSDDSVQYEEYPEYVNEPCPDCGNNLLTIDDYNKCKSIIRLLTIYNIIVFPVHFVRYLFSKEYRNTNTVGTYKF